MFGSPKSIAKTMVRSYMAYRTRFPDLSDQQALRKALEARYPPGSKYAITWDSLADDEKDIKSLTMYVIMAETDTLLNAGDFKRYEQISDIIDQVIDQMVPEHLQ